MPYCTGCCRGTGPCTSGIPRHRRGATSNTMSCGARRGRRRRRRRRPRPSPRRWQVVAHLPVRLRALAPGTLLSVCDGGRPEFRLVRGLLQKDDDEDVEQDDEDADDGLFRHLAGSALVASNFSRAARRHHPASPRASPGARPAASSGTPPPGLALHQRAASRMHFHIQIMRGLEPRKQLAQSARRLRSKVAHWRSPSFSMTTTKRIGLQCQISMKTRSLLYPDIKPEPGGEQLPWRLTPRAEAQKKLREGPEQRPFSTGGPWVGNGSMIAFMKIGELGAPCGRSFGGAARSRTGRANAIPAGWTFPSALRRQRNGSATGSHHRQSSQWSCRVARATKYTLLGGQKDTVGMIRLLGSGALLVHTITTARSSQTTGVSHLTQISSSPFHSWERGLNEHTNGLVREYFPKGTDFRATCNEDVQKVRLNTRKVPGSPTEVILK